MSISINAATVLFADTFDRGNSTDLNASSAGKSGTLGALTYGEIGSTGNMSINGNQLAGGDSAAGSGWSIAYINNHNFTDASISTVGGFSVSIDIVSFASAGNGRYMGFGIGHSLTELSGLSGTLPGQVGGNADVVIGYDSVGATQGIAVFKNGVQFGSHTAFPPGFPARPDTLTVTYTFSNFTAGSTVGYEVFLDTTSVLTGSTVWSGTNENYISINSNLSAEQARFDNLAITIVPEPSAVLLCGLGALCFLRRKRG